jgi:hypothetical protein
VADLLVALRCCLRHRGYSPSFFGFRPAPVNTYGQPSFTIPKGQWSLRAFYIQLLNTEMTSEKAAYTSQLMYIISLAFAKQIVLQLFTLLARNSPRVRTVYTISGVSVTFSLIMLFSAALQCVPATPWAIFSPKCFDQVSEPCSPRLFTTKPIREDHSDLVSECILEGIRSFRCYHRWIYACAGSNHLLQSQHACEDQDSSHSRVFLTHLVRSSCVQISYTRFLTVCPALLP